MGCGASRIDNAGEGRQRRQLRYVERKKGPAPAVEISKPLPAEEDDSSKGKVRYDERGGDGDKDECPEDDGSYIPHSLSFRVYCNSPSDDNTPDDTNMMDKQEAASESHKKSSTRTGRRAKIGKGLKCILRG